MVAVLPVNPLSPEAETIERAVRVVSEGGIIVYPTDTVYGVGTNALDSRAVLKVFEVKKRPLGQPLPVAVGGIQMAETLAVVVSEARRLMLTFWPGALTLVLRKKTIVPDVTTGGRLEVALRAPNHQVPLRIMSLSGLPLIATSANTHRKPSCLTAEEAESQLGDKVDLILDGGSATGRPSTVLDLMSTPPRVLRSGSVTRKDIRRVLSSSVS